jgi:hypothetical protein
MKIGFIALPMASPSSEFACITAIADDSVLFMN